MDFELLGRKSAEASGISAEEIRQTSLSTGNMMAAKMALLPDTPTRRDLLDALGIIRAAWETADEATLYAWLGLALETN
jgi:hypothetical protein